VDQHFFKEKYIDANLSIQGSHIGKHHGGHFNSFSLFCTSQDLGSIWNPFILLKLKTFAESTVDKSKS